MTFSTDDHNSIAVIGMAGRFPGARDLDEFGENIANGVDCISSADDDRLLRAGVPPALLADPAFVRRSGKLDQVEYFDAAFFDMAPGEAEITDPQHRLLLECAYEAIESAGYNPFGTEGPVGVFAAVGISDYLLANIALNPASIASQDAMRMLIGNDKSYASTRISHKLNLTGPSITIDTACSSSLVAIHEACKALLLNECDMALAGAARIAVPNDCGYQYLPGGVLSPDGYCRPLDAAACGTVPGNGAGMVLLKRFVDAVTDGDTIRAVIRGGAVNNDGSRKIGFTAPSSGGQSRVIAQALLAANVPPQSVEYVELHGTGTSLGDPLEIESLTKAYKADTRRQACAIGSVKGNLGHLDVAAGMAGFMKTVLAVEQGFLPPTIHYATPHPEIDLQASPFYVNTSLKPWPAGENPRRAGVSSFGIGGTNAHVILEQGPSSDTRAPTGDAHIVCLSARSAEALQATAGRTAEYLKDRDLPLADVAYTLSSGRPHFDFRLAMVSADTRELVAGLAERASRMAGKSAPPSRSAPQTVAFLFTGQGSQYTGMCERLYRRFAAFRTMIDEIDRLMAPHLPCSLKELLWEEKWSACLDETRYTQPALFAVEYSLAHLWASFGVRPSYVLGHSVGEVAAACFAGMFSLEDGVELVCARGRLMQECGTAGAMLAIFADPDSVRALLRSGEGRVEVAAINGPKLVIVSGAERDIGELAQRLTSLNVASTQLPVRHAFHSRAFDRAGEELRQVAARIRFQRPSIPMVSNLGTHLSAQEQISPDYWSRQMREAVDFRADVEFLQDKGVTCYVEVGPGSTLAKLVRSCVSTEVTRLHSTEQGRDAVRTLLSNVARYYEVGGELDWDALRDGSPHRRVRLPTYPFQRTRHWSLPEAIWSPVHASAKPASIARVAEANEPIEADVPEHGLYPMQRRVAAIWSELLSVRVIGPDADFFALGGDSLLIVQMHERIRERLGIVPPLNTLMENPTLSQFTAALEHLAAKSSPQQVARLNADPANRHAPFPLMEIQQAYLAGRTGSFDFGGHSTHLYFEIRPRDFDRDRFSEAVNKLIARHDMLRAVICGDNQQRILSDVGRYEIRYYDFESDAAAAATHLETLRKEMSHQVLPAGVWPLFDIRVTRLSASQVIIHFSLDMLMLDAVSNRVLFRDLELIYQGKEELLPPLQISYRDYVMARVAARSSGEYAKAREYWTSRIAELPLAPDLPVLNDAGSRGASGFRRRLKVLDRRTTNRLKQKARGSAITPSVLLMTAYGLVLAAWSQRASFTIDISISDRVPLHENVNDLLGEFTMVSLLAMDFGEAGSFREHARRVQRQLWRDYEHKEFNGVEVLRELSRFYGGDRQAMMPIVFTSILPVEGEGTAAALKEQNFLADEDLYSISQTPQVWIDHFVADEEGQFVLSWDCREGMFPEGMLDDLFEAYTGLVARLANDDEAWQSPQLALLPQKQADQRALTHDRCDAPRSRQTLASLFSGRAATQPEALALVQPGMRLNYGELYSLCRVWAQRIAERGVGRGDLVAIVMHRGWEQVVAALAVHMAGAAYVAVDVDLPTDRRSEILGLCAPRCLLTQPGLKRDLDRAIGKPVLAVEKLAGVAGSEWLPESVNASDLAYVLWTSGLREETSGIAVSHETVVSTVLDINERFAVRESDRVLALSPLSDGLSVYDIFGALAAGAAIVLPPAGANAADHDSLEAVAVAESVTVLNAHPATVQSWVESLERAARPLPGSMRLMLLSGDSIPLKLPSRIWTRAGRKIELASLAGMSGAGVWSLAFPIREVRKEWHSIPCGTPLTNQSACVLRGDLTPCPDWVRGELYIGGTGLSLGYWKNDGKTKREFIVHPQSGERLYRTGDHARYLPEGTIELLGREELQVEVNGFRVDLGEIESVLLEEEISQALVMPRQADGVEKQLIAYLVRDAAGGSVGPGNADVVESSRRRCKARLPVHMVPHHYVVLDALPLNAQGRVDRHALPPPQSARPPQGVRGGARSDVEQSVTRILGELMHRTDLVPQDNFFMLGGHSLIAAQLATRVRETLGAEISIRTVFDNPTIADLAVAVSDAMKPESTLPPLPDVREGEPPVLSSAQQRLWFVHQLQQSSPGYAAAYNLPMIWRIHGALDPARLRRSLQRLLQRHSVLRTAFLDDGGKPKAVVHNNVEIPWTYVDLLGQADPQRRYTSHVERIIGTRFDLSRAPLVSAALFKWKGDEHSLVINVHHIVTDLWSAALITREIGELYDQECPPPSQGDVARYQYARYAKWQREVWDSGLMRKHEDYWLGRMASLPAPLRLLRAGAKSGPVSCSAGAIPFEIQQQTAARLKAFAATQGMTPFAVLLAGFNVLLHFYSGETDIIVGTDTANREPKETEQIIGYFINQVAIRTRVHANTVVRDYLASVRDAVAEAFEHEAMPFERLLEKLKIPRDSESPPLFQVMLNYHSVTDAEPVLAGLRIVEEEVPRKTAHYDLVLTFKATGDGLIGTLQYRDQRFSPAAMQELIESYQHLLAQILEGEDRRIGQLQYQAAQSRERYLSTIPVAAQYPQNATLDQRFTQIARIHAQSVALNDPAGSMTYEALDAASNRVANALRARGVNPGDYVALCLESQRHQIVAILGVLKAGAAYAPVEARWPRERIKLILQGVRPRVLIADSDAGVLPGWDSGVSVVSWDELQKGASETPLEVRHTAAYPAYVIHTSGTTGVPKGVVITHGHVGRLFDSTREDYQFGQDEVWCLFHSCVFDLSVWEMWGAMLYGARLVLVPRETACSAQEMFGLIEREGITFLTQTPSAFRNLAKFLRADARRRRFLSSLKWIVCAGEKLEASALLEWFDGAGSGGPQINNMYGITETTVHSTFHVVQRSEVTGGASLVGKPLADLEIYILDERLNPVPPGVTGEIHVGGEGVATGYLGKPAATAQRMLPNPFSASSSRLYRSGDLARWTDTGLIDYIGRRDNQIKIRGYRIELGEVETCLLAHPGVSQGIVRAEKDNHGELSIAAYWKGAEPGAPTAREVCAWLHSRLPEYMVPSKYREVSHFQLTVNGKIDRAHLHLREDEEDPKGAAAGEEALTQVRTKLLALVADAVGAKNVTLADNFFEIGGHSLVATQLHSHINETFEIGLPLKAVLDAPSIGDLFAAIEWQITSKLARATVAVERSVELLEEVVS